MTASPNHVRIIRIVERVVVASPARGFHIGVEPEGMYRNWKGPRVFLGVLILVGIADLGVFAAQRLVNDARLSANAPPLWEFSIGGVLVLYALQMAAFLGLRHLLRPRLARWHRSLFTGLFALLVLRAGVVVYGYQSPIDRGRLSATAGRVASIDAKLQNYRSRKGSLPENLAALNTTAEGLEDGWGFRLSYKLDDDGNGYSLEGIGVPDRLRDMTNYSRREIRRRFESADDNTSPVEESSLAVAGAHVRIGDDSDWWSWTRQLYDSAEDLVAQDRVSEESNFKILGIRIDSDFDVIRARLGDAVEVERGDASTGRLQLCYVSRSGRVHLVFESGEINRVLYLFEDGPGWVGSDRCSTSELVSASVATASGLKLGMSPVQVRAVLGKPSREEIGRIVYWHAYKTKTPDEVLRRARKNNPAMTDEEFLANYGHLDVGVLMEARFQDSELNYLAISKKSCFTAQKRSELGW